jgi:hypothetical protein
MTNEQKIAALIEEKNSAKCTPERVAEIDAEILKLQALIAQAANR